jgi:hypothetical protein
MEPVLNNLSEKEKHEILILREEAFNRLDEMENSYRLLLILKQFNNKLVVNTSGSTEELIEAVNKLIGLLNKQELEELLTLL